MRKKILFIYKEEILVKKAVNEDYIINLENLEFYPKVFQNLSKIVQEFNYSIVMLSKKHEYNSKDKKELFVHNKIIKTFENEGIVFEENIIVGDKLEQFAKYLYGNYDIANSFVISANFLDLQLSDKLSCKSILLNKEENKKEDFCTKNWAEIYNLMKKNSRTASIIRSTSETKIEVKINLDGTGKKDIKTGLSFFDHMLEQIAKHGEIDLTVKVDGDLEVDEHHTIEDTAIVLGEAFVKALGNKQGIERYGFLLPMDECLAQVAIDFCGRAWLVWEADFKREKIGDMPTEMFMHFFKSFSDNAKCNLNIKAEGQNEHHKIEAIFKAFAKAIKQAINKVNNSIPSTKGSL